MLKLVNKDRAYKLANTWCIFGYVQVVFQASKSIFIVSVVCCKLICIYGNMEFGYPI